MQAEPPNQERQRILYEILGHQHLAHRAANSIQSIRQPGWQATYQITFLQFSRTATETTEWTLAEKW